MALPRKPERSAPIPNEPFESPEVSSIRGPYWDMTLGEGLELDSDGSIIAPDGTGNTISDQATINSSYFTAGIGKGLGVVGGNEFSRMDCPPYGCRTDVYTAGVSDFSSAWAQCDSLTSFPALNFGKGLFFDYTWFFCTNLTSFPLIDTSSGVYFSGSWANCFRLTSFPQLDVSSGSNFIGTWAGCSGLTSFPLLNTSSGEQFTATWQNCAGLTSFPSLNVSQGIDFSSAWQNCNSLTSFPLLDVSSGTNFSGTWGNCFSLTSFPALDFSKGTGFSETWYNCNSLTSFPTIDLRSGGNFNSAWRDCTSLTTFPAGLFDNCSSNDIYAFYYSWYNCALNQTSVNNILVSLNNSGMINSYVSINGGTSAAPGPAGLAAKLSLQGKGWTVLTN